MPTAKTQKLRNYSSQDTIYCYPGTDVLKNLFGIRSQPQLDKIERLMSGARLAELRRTPVIGAFDLKHLCDIHHYIFQDIYAWAGCIRIVNISKDSYFCCAEYIERESRKLFASLRQQDCLKRCSLSELPEHAAYYLSEINAIHPFRDGNGRTQREFLRELMLTLGYDLRFSRVPPEMMLTASVESFEKGDCTTMTKLIAACIVPAASGD